MSLVLDLPPELESQLTAEAHRMGLPLGEYVKKVLLSRRPPQPLCCSGSELVSYWRDEGLIGTRQDIPDSQAHARALRQHAEQREHT